MNQLVPANNTSTKEVGFAAGASGSSIAPQNLGEVIRFAEVMCKADIAIPKHLRGNAGACMAVAMQALEWQMNPFAVASKSYSVNGLVAYEAQLINAVVNTRSGIKGRLKYTFDGTGNDLTCRVVGVLDGEECEYTSPPIGSITTKNSPLWKSDPQQQLGYYSARSWARRHCPEVILGVYDRDEAETFQGPDNAKDITPSLADRLAQAKSEPQDDQQAEEGFDPAFVRQQTSDAPDEAADEQEPASSPTLGDDAAGSGGATSEPAADQSPSPESGGETDGIEAADGQSAPSVSEPGGLSAEDRHWLKMIAKMLWAATAVNEQELLAGTMKGILANHTPETIGADAKAKFKSVYAKCKLVCFGEASSADMLAEIAIVAGVEPKDILP